MPRQAAASAEFVTGTAGTRMLLKAPDDLDQLERLEFTNLIMGASSSHFLPSDIPLIACYAKAIVAERIAAGELSAAPVVSSDNGDRPSPWLPVWVARQRAVTTLARMLSLSLAGRVPGKSNEQRPPMMSAYERIALERRDDAN
jgi:hypothetical protein